VATSPHLYLIAARDLFESDAAWLHSLTELSTCFRPIRDVSIAVQIRIEVRHSDAQRLASAALEIVRREHDAGRLPLFLNASAVDAARLGYDGVHWPERRTPAEPSASNLVSAASVHSLRALRRAEQSGAAFAVFGSVWAPRWKQATPVGVDALHTVAAASSIPVLAIGAVTPERVAPCLHAGAAGVAVASGVFRARSQAEALTDYARALRGSAPPSDPPS
jgi:thiamine-phosphate diphosphorylase